MKRVRLCVVLALCVIGYATAASKQTGHDLPTKKESAEMLRQADDFIDAVSDGRQDRQADAVLHAIRGQGAELLAIRNSRRATHVVSKSVKAQDIIGDGSARGLKMRLYRPLAAAKKPLPLLVYFHGGGWTWGGIESCAAFCDALAATGKVMVLAVDYSLAPEKPFPAGLMDCVSSVEYAFSHAKKWGSAAGMVSAGGDSSGGNLALATALYMNKNATAGQRLHSLVLLYPVVKAYADKESKSWKKYGRGYGLDKRLMEAFCDAYIAKGNKNDPLVSPVDATPAQLSKLPPMLLVGAERDILRDQGAEFAGKLKNVRRVEFPGAVHLFITVPGQKAAFDKAVSLVSSYLD